MYDSNGVATVNVKFPYWHATSAYIKKFNITTKTEVDKSLYNSTEDIDITVTGVLSGSKSVKYDGELKTTLPKGISYKVGSSNYGEPMVTDNDGTQMLRWKYEKKDLNAGNAIEIKFKATSDFSKLTFKNTGYTDKEAATEGNGNGTSEKESSSTEKEPVKVIESTKTENKKVETVKKMNTEQKGSVDTAADELPKTGESSSNVFLSLLGIFMSTGVVAFLLKKKKSA